MIASQGDLPRVRVAKAWKPKARDLSCGLMHLHKQEHIHGPNSCSFDTPK